jgi:hypothetical protein
MAGPLGGAGRSPAVATTEAEEDVDGGPLRVLAKVRQQPPLKLRKVSMAGPLGGTGRSPAAATTEVEEDVDGGPP